MKIDSCSGPIKRRVMEVQMIIMWGLQIDNGSKHDDMVVLIQNKDLWTKDLPLCPR